MAFSNQIGKYRLHYYGKRESDADSIAQIMLFNDSDNTVGYVVFYRDGQTIPNNSAIETSNPKQVVLTMHERQLDTVVDMLRNEKPCYIWYIRPTNAQLCTGTEPIGEEEFKV